MQQNYLMEEVLQGKRILDDVMNKKVPHLTRLNLFPFSFSFLRQLDKEALNQYLEQLQNMWEAYLRTKGTIQQPLFLQHLDFLQQIQIWYIKNNVLSNNAVHTRLRPVRPQTTKREEPQTGFGNKEDGSEVDSDDDDGSEVEGHEDLLFDKGKRRMSMDDGRGEKARERDRERDRWDRRERDERRDIEKKKRSGDSDWREDWEFSSKHRKGGGKKHRRKESDSRKHKKKRYDERDRKEKRKRDKSKKKKKSSKGEDSEEERERTFNKHKRSLLDSEMSKSENDSEDNDEDLDESVGFSIFSHRGAKRRRREKSVNEEDILGSIVATDTPEHNARRDDDSELASSSASLRRSINIPLSTLTSSLNSARGNTGAPSEGGPNSGPNSGPTNNADADADAQSSQTTLSYRDASQILFNPRQPSYKGSASIGAKPVYYNSNNNSDIAGLIYLPYSQDQSQEHFASQAQDQNSDSNQTSSQADLAKTDMGSSTEDIAKEGERESLARSQSDELVHNESQSQKNLNEYLAQEEKDQTQQSYNSRVLMTPRHYEHFTQDPHQMRQYQNQLQKHAGNSQRGLSQSGEHTPISSVSSAKSEKRLSRYRSSPSKALLERMEAAIASRMHVLRRFPINPEMELSRKYTILGTTGSVYTITISNLPACNCPDSAKGHHCCHILFVLLKILKVSQHEAVLYQRALLNAELREIYKEAPPNPAATITLPPFGATPTQAQIAGDCPVCCEPFLNPAAFTENSEPVLWCKGGCGSNVHKTCLEIYASHTVQPQFPDKAFCPVCETEWISDGKIIKKTPEKEVKPKRGKKEKPKPAQVS